MKEQYQAPTAEKIEFNYLNTVVASGNNDTDTVPEETVIVVPSVTMQNKNKCPGTSRQNNKKC